jgi:GGDEF domain-containing protein
MRPWKGIIMKSKPSFLRLTLYSVVLGIWLILAGFTLAGIDPRNTAISLALLAVTFMVSILVRYDLAGLGTAVAAAAVFAYTAMRLAEAPSDGLIKSILAAVVLVITALIAALTRRSYRDLAWQSEQNQKLVDELSLFDHETKLMKWGFARQSLKLEIDRCQRFNSSLCLGLFEVVQWKDSQRNEGMVGLVGPKQQLAMLMSGAFRSIDTPFSSMPFSGDNLGVLMPQTDLPGAIIATNRVINKAAQTAQLDIHAGIVRFPGDGTTIEELVEAARTALQKALSTGQPYAILEEKEGPAAESPAPVLSWSEPGLTSQDELPLPEMVAEKLSNLAPGAAVSEALVSITGIRQITRIQDIEQILRVHPEVKDVNLLEFSNHTLYLWIRHVSNDILHVLEELFGVEATWPQAGNRWIQIDWKEEV